MTVTIGEAAKQLGITVSAIRYYESCGLLPPAERTPAGVRSYTPEDVQSIFLVLCLKKMGLSLKAIREYLQLERQGDSTIESRSRILSRQKLVLEQKRRELDMMLGAIDYKCWLFEKAKVTGHEAAKAEMMAGNVPKRYKQARSWWLGIETENEKGE